MYLKTTPVFVNRHRDRRQLIEHLCRRNRSRWGRVRYAVRADSSPSCRRRAVGVDEIAVFISIRRDRHRVVDNRHISTDFGA